MDRDIATAKVLAALGTPVRLSIFRLLVRAGEDGLNVGDIGRHLDLPPSTLAHHLGALAGAGIVSQRREGREVKNVIAFEALRGALDYVMSDCCAGVPFLKGSAA